LSARRASRMKLVMFDVDGTLTQASQADWEYYVAALRRLVRVEHFSLDWSVYPHVTDSAILDYYFMAATGKAPQTSEVDAFQQAFTQGLASQVAANPERFQPMPGADAVLERLLRSSDYGVALATGGWRRPALFKLHAAGLTVEGLPAAFADDGHSREEIMETACWRASEHYGCPGFETVIYVGDGAHDVRAARNLSYGFIGIAEAERAEKLRAAGARYVTADFTDLAAFLSLLDEAERACGRVEPGLGFARETHGRNLDRRKQR